MKKLLIITITSIFILSSCSSSKLVAPESEGEKLSILYADALKKTKKKDYVDAALIFEDIERQYPYSSWAGQAQLMASFCYLRSNMHDESLNVIDRYLALNPGSKDIDYAYYMKGMNYYNQISDVQRDQSISYVALEAFNEVINRFSNSEYAEVSKEKIKIIRDRLAGKELNIASQYQKDDQWVAAINRYNNVLEICELKNFESEFNENQKNVSDFGKNISGGQLQRIGIARALYQNKEILIFDEATNALDEDLEKKIVSRLNEMKKGKILIFVSHNQKLLNIFDHVYEIKDGNIFKTK